MRRIKLILLTGMVSVLMIGCGAKPAASTMADTSAVSVAEQDDEKKETEAPTIEEETTKKEITEAETIQKTTADNGGNIQSVDGSLSDNIYSFQISIDGKIHQFPMKYSEFIAHGWEYDGDENAVLDSMYKAGTQVFNKGKLQCYATVVNFDINAQPVNMSYITGITLEDRENKGGVQIIMPKGIQLGISTREEIKAAYGEPTTDSNLDSGSSHYSYDRDVYQGVEFSFYADKMELNKIEINNIALPEDFEAGEVSGDVPEVVGKYQAPGEVSDDFSQFTVNYGEHIYRLPAPVSEFEKNGWSIQEDKSDNQVAGRDFGWVTMMKDNQALKVIANNYSDQATSIHNCFVKTVISDDRTKIPLVISGGITVGMNQEDVLKALSNEEYEEKNDSDLYTYYKVKPGTSSLDSYEIYIHKSDQKVYKIEVENSPKFNQIEKWLNQ